jgi:DivIVA domain-containing protein
MAMTPADVHAQQFTTVRMRTGYDMDEVDAFLDAVESEISRLLAENDDLRAQLTQAQSRVLAAEQKAAKAPVAPPAAPAPRQGSNVVEVKPAATPSAAAPTSAAPTSAAPTSAAPTSAATPAPAAPPVEATPASEQALRMLELAQRTADETVAQARTEAHSIVSKAKEEARVVTADLDSQRIALEKQVGELRTFERNYRVKLRDHIAGQLAEFDAAVRAAVPAVEEPAALQAILGGDETPAEITAEQRALPNVGPSHPTEAEPKSDF